MKFEYIVPIDYLAGTQVNGLKSDVRHVTYVPM